MVTKRKPKLHPSAVQIQAGLTPALNPALNPTALSRTLRFGDRSSPVAQPSGNFPLILLRIPKGESREEPKLSCFSACSQIPLPPPNPGALSKTDMTLCTNGFSASSATSALHISSDQTLHCRAVQSRWIISKSQQHATTQSWKTSGKDIHLTLQQLSSAKSRTSQTVLRASWKPSLSKQISKTFQWFGSPVVSVLRHQLLGSRSDPAGHPRPRFQSLAFCVSLRHVQIEKYLTCGGKQLKELFVVFKCSFHLRNSGNALLSEARSASPLCAACRELMFLGSKRGLAIWLAHCSFNGIPKGPLRWPFRGKKKKTARPPYASKLQTPARFPHPAR